MEGWIEGCMEGWIEGCMEGWIEGCMEGWIEGSSEKLIYILACMISDKFPYYNIVSNTKNESNASA
jgi:hypothetical protein